MTPAGSLFRKYATRQPEEPGISLDRGSDQRAISAIRCLEERRLHRHRVLLDRPLPGTDHATPDDDHGAEYTTTSVDSPRVLGVQDIAPIPVRHRELIPRWQQIRVTRAGTRGLRFREPERPTIHVLALECRR